MGAYYEVILKIKLKDEQGAVVALNEYIRNDISTNYSLERYAQQGITTGNFDDLIRIYLAGWEGQEVKISKVEGVDIYQNIFYARYGWEIIILEMIEVLAAFLEDGSEFMLYVDDNYTNFVVRDGKCTMIH